MLAAIKLSFNFKNYREHETNQRGMTPFKIGMKAKSIYILFQKKY